MSDESERTTVWREHEQRALMGGAAKYHDANAARGKLFVRARIEYLVDAGSFIEDGRLANTLAEGLPSDAVVTGSATVHGRAVRIIANDSTVKAGSWGARTVEKMIRTIEAAYRDGVPVVYLIDSAGARITDQVDLFPGRRGAGRIFWNQVRASGAVPQVCGLFGPSAAGGAYIPAFCDLVVMVDGNASMYLASDRMVEMVTGERTSLEEMGGARMHCEVSGLGHLLAADEHEALDAIRIFLTYLPQNWQSQAEVAVPTEAARNDIATVIPEPERTPYDVMEVIDSVIDAHTFFEIHRLWAPEIVVGLARLNGEVIGIVANNPMHKGGVLFVDSADKATRFIQMCDAYNIPLLFLTDVPGFMVGTEVERQGIIRHGAKLIFAVSEATVPKICVVLRKAYGAGLYAMCGPGFDADATLALPTARIAVMGPEAAVNAVYANTIAGLAEDDRPEFVAAKREAYEQDIDILRLAADLVVDAVIDPAQLRDELIGRYRALSTKDREFSRRRHGVTPV
jgi:methylmalonyl-CoA decarboxylase subunit alpha